MAPQAIIATACGALDPLRPRKTRAPPHQNGEEAGLRHRCFFCAVPALAPLKALPPAKRLGIVGALRQHPQSLISPHVRPLADRRFRVPSHPADRPQGARSRGLLRGSPLPARSTRPTSKSSIHAASSCPAAPPRSTERPVAVCQSRHLYRQPAGAGHLLRRADHGEGTRRAGRGRPSPRVRLRPRRKVEGQAGLRPVRRRLAAGRPQAGLDEPWRPRDPAAVGLLGHRRQRQRALRRNLRREAQILRRCSSTPRSSIRPMAPGCCATLR